MANKKLKVGATSEVKLPTKKNKEDKKPKWVAKTGDKKVKEPEVESLVQESPALPPEPTDAPMVSASSEDVNVEPTGTDEVATTTDSSTPTEANSSPAPADVAVPPKMSRKLKVQADLQPKKLSMIKAALQVLQERKVPMTCPELIDVMATEDLWVSPGGKTPAPTLYAAIARSIKDLGKASLFRKVERGRLEAKVV